MPITQGRYQVRLHGVRTMAAFVSAFNRGLIQQAGGHWSGNNWDAFNDYLSWPVEEAYALVLEGWADCDALHGRDLAMFEEILANNRHVSVHRT